MASRPTAGEASKARTKTEAQRLADDLERRAERVRLGIEAPLPEDGGGTVAVLASWWLDSRRSTPTHLRDSYVTKRDILPDHLGREPLVQVTPGHIEEYLLRKAARNWHHRA